MYKYKKNKRRIDWIYQQFSGTNSFSVESFLTLVNKLYYKHSTKLYSHREIGDIEDQFHKMFVKTGLLDSNSHLNIINIGGGQGFEYNQFQKNKIKYDSYCFIEPDQNMSAEFKGKFQDYDKKLEIVNSTYTKLMAEEKNKISNKLIVINSCLHHFIQIEDILSLVKQSLNKGDLFFLSHEPNNDYSKSILKFFRLIFRFLFTRAIIDKTLRVLRLNTNDNFDDRWSDINQELLDVGAIKKRMKPLVIRRIVDYGVNTKDDWKLIRITDDWNEGYWTPATVEDFFGGDYTVEYFNSYRHFGDDYGSNFIKYFNNLFSKIFHGGKKGSVFSMVIKRRIQKA